MTAHMQTYALIVEEAVVKDGERRGGTHGESGTISRFKRAGGVKSTAIRMDIYPQTMWVGTSDNGLDPELQGPRLRIASRRTGSRSTRTSRSSSTTSNDSSRTIRRPRTLGGYARTRLEGGPNSSSSRPSSASLSPRARTDWPLEERKAALSPEALSAVVMPRTHIYHAVKREVNKQLRGRVGFDRVHLPDRFRRLGRAPA